MALSAMVDLETLGHTPTASIIEIGVVLFTPDGDLLPPLDEISNTTTFYQRINLESCLSYGLTVDASTLAFWLKQGDAQRLEIANAIETGVDLKAALRSMVTWLRSFSINRVWSHGASFDCPILEFAAKRVGYSLSWHFKQIRDTRTLEDLSGLKYSSSSGGDKTHNALNDAYRQSVWAQHAWRKIKGAPNEGLSV